MRATVYCWHCGANVGDQRAHQPSQSADLRNSLPAATGCDAARTAGTPDRAAIDQLQSQIASSTGYEAYSVEVLASAVHLLVSISDRELARSDEAERDAW